MAPRTEDTPFNSPNDGSSATFGEWQPMVTAPMDGTPVILFARAKTATASAPVFGWWLDKWGWVESAFAPNRPVGIVPSAWMPRPSFPNHDQSRHHARPESEVEAVGEAKPTGEEDE